MKSRFEQFFTIAGTDPAIYQAGIFGALIEIFTSFKFYYLISKSSHSFSGFFRYMYFCRSI